MSTAILGDFFILKSLFGEAINDQEGWFRQGEFLVHPFPKDNFRNSFSTQKGIQKIVFLFSVRDGQCMIKDYKDLIQAAENYFKGSSPNVGIVLMFENTIISGSFIESIVAQTPYYKKYSISNRIETCTREAFDQDSLKKLSELSTSLGEKPPLPLEKQNELFTPTNIGIAVIAFLLVYFLLFSGSKATNEQTNLITQLKSEVANLKITEKNWEQEKKEKISLQTELSTTQTQLNTVKTELSAIQTERDGLKIKHQKCEVELKELNDFTDDLEERLKQIQSVKPRKPRKSDD